MVPVLPPTTARLSDSGVSQVSQTQQNDTSPDVMKQFHGLLLAEVYKGCIRTNRQIAGNSSLSLASNSALEETFWNNVLVTVVEQSSWSARLQASAEGQSS